MYYQPEANKTYLTHSEIRSALANVLFPSVIDDDMLAYVGIFPLTSTPPTVAASETAEPTMIEEIDGIWVQQWNVRPATQEELDARAAAVAAQVPQQVSRRQARQALLLAGLLDQVPAKIAMIEDPTKRGMAQIEWDDSQVFERHRPLLIEIGTAIGLDAAGLDKLFIEAGNL
ncbi:hypothetical protein [Massilia sp. TN1-12]|uniref:hypothetical protein n=1 Tax=Massilia paldalensis TaxID=3377675 RepID=UPI00384B3889